MRQTIKQRTKIRQKHKLNTSPMWKVISNKIKCDLENIF